MRIVVAIVLAITVLTTAQDLDAYMRQVTERRGFNGAVLVAGRDGVRLHEGYGTDAMGAPITAETVFDVGSVSKQFTGAAILHAEQRGLLNVDQPIIEYLPDVPPDKAAITIHHLLTHTAGFREDHFDDDLTPMSPDEALSAIYSIPLRTEPGAEYHYSNTGYTLLALIVQRASGQPFTTYMHDHLFDPAGMESTGFYGEEHWSERPVAHTIVNGDRYGSPAEWPGPYWGVLGNGGVMSTTGDLHRWLQAVHTGTVLEPNQVEKFYTPYVPEGGSTSYAYGWSIAETPHGTLIQHNGGGIGGNSHVAMYPDAGLTLIVTSNQLTYLPPLIVRLPATEVADQLAANIFADDYDALPRTTWNAIPILAGALAFIGIGVVVWLRRRKAP